ncbi:MAG: Bug family tripartite tricarboxylate transporter substrate binding protein [Burkholderiales bacterium]
MKRLFVVPAILLIVSTAFGQAYPTKPIRLVVPSAAGGTPDIQARIIANELGKQTGQQVVVDNRAGASGIVGYEVIAKSAPDGYTLGYSAFTFITNSLTYSKLSYDAAKDFQPIIRQVSGTNIVSVTPALPVRSARELVELARAEPRKLSYGANGGGSSQQLSLELLKNMSGTQITQVYYKAIQQAIADTIGGQIQVVCDNSPSILPHVLSGRLRAIGVTGLNRIPAAPDIPTIAEQGFPGYEMAPSSGYMFPARTPREIVLRMNAELNKALQSPRFAETVVPSGSTVTGGTPEQFAEHIRRETLKWGAVIKAAGIKAD